MKIKSAKYAKRDGNNVSITVLYENSDRALSVPLTEDNTDYAEIMRQVDAGELTNESADE